MISTQFKKKVIKFLENEYNIVCHAISMKDQINKEYQEYSLSCETNLKLFNMTLRVNICHVDAPSGLHSFHVFLASDSVDFVYNLKEQITYDIVRDAISEVRNIFSYLSPRFGFLFINTTVTLITGIYFVGSSYFELKSIKSVVDTTHVVNIYDCIKSEQRCSNINIINNAIYVYPWITYTVYPTFKEPSSLLSGDLELFKANFAKNVILFLNKNYRTADEHNNEEADYMPLNYEDLKRYLLVYKMSSI